MRIFFYPCALMESSFKRSRSSGFEGRGGGRGGSRGFARTEGSGGGRGRGGGSNGDRFRDRDRSAAGMSSSRQWSGSYRPQVADESVPRPHLPGERSRGRGRGGSTSTPYGGARDGFHHRGGRPPTSHAAPRAQGSSSGNNQNNSHGSRSGEVKPRDVVVILEKAGILMGNMGLVDAYDRAATTEIANASLKDVRPDIVHQCLLALFDSDLAYQHRLRVYISLFSRQGKVIEVSPALRPPRTYTRFRGLMAALLRDGRVCSTDGRVLMRLMPGSIAPIIPHGAEVTGLTNALNAPVVTATQLAQQAAAAPVDDALQGGIKHVTAFYCISCTDDCNLDGIDYITRSVCLSAYPMTAHVQSARICEGHTRVEPDVHAAARAKETEDQSNGKEEGNRRSPPQPQQQKSRAGEVFPVDQGDD